MSGSAFMSYSRDDSEFALRLARDLKAAGAQVWLDQLDIKAGTSWDNAIEEALGEATHMLIILSPASSRSSNVRNEISYAKEQGKVVIPVLYTECTVPLQLQRNQRIDFRTDYACGLTTLVHQLQGSPSPSVPKVEDGYPGHQQHEKAPERSHASPEVPLTDARRRPETQQPNQSSTPPHKPWWSSPALPISLASLVLVAAIASAAVWVHHGKNPEVLYQKAVIDSSLKDYPDAAKLYKQACDAGNAKSCTALALFYETGKLDIPKDPISELKFYGAGCDNGDYEACGALGRLYFIGGAVQRDLDQASKFDQEACNGGDLTGCSQLGILYVRGEGVAHDPKKGIALFQKACDGNDPAGCSALGKYYATGDVVPKDAKKAVAADQKACDAGHASSCTRLGDLYRTGDGVNQNTYIAKQLYQKGCLAGDGKACDAWLAPPPNVAAKP
jgi:TPR repeat protein